MIDNICYFIPYHNDYQSIHTINFVYETKPQFHNSLKSETVYKVHYVYKGEGLLHTLGKVQALSVGDVFFTFPGSPFFIESKIDFSYMYISFLGTRANVIMEKLTISNNNFYFTDCFEIAEFWEKAFRINQDLTDLIAESVLLYTFSFIGNKLLVFIKNQNKPEKTFLIIKKYLDDNFTNSELSLDNLSVALSYNPKYISGIFKKKMGIGIVDYLNTIRIQHACTLMNQGFTIVNELSRLSGYSDPLYFSKVFKKKMGKSPKQYTVK